MANTLLTIVRYPKYFGWAGIFSMALFHFVLFFNKNIGFYKLMGCGKNGTFDKTPDWLQWSTLLVFNQEQDSIQHKSLHTKTPSFILAFYRFFRAEVFTITLQPIEGHGFWDGKTPFGDLAKNTEYDGPIAVLTRATIRFSKLKNFWQNVDAVANQMAGADGFITSFGIGEVPFIKQATFSIWESKMKMKNFAYKLHQHADVIRKTRKEDWYSEDMFVRFIRISHSGTLYGKDVLAEIA